MDKIIFGDNQFFGVNHMSEKTALNQMQKFRSPDDIFHTLEYVNQIGIKSFMFTTHDKLDPVFKKIKANPDFHDFKLIPCMPYAHKYANAMVELGITGTVRKFIPGSKVFSFFKMIQAAITANPIPIMRLLVDSELKQYQGMNVEAIFLLNIVTDILIGLGMHNMLYEFARYTEEKYGVKAGFFTMNYVALNDILVNKLQMKNPMICTNINKIGFRMNPSLRSVEDTVNKNTSFNIAMSFLASGALKPKESVDYLKGLHGVNAVLFGASSPEHIKETKDLLETL
ncbi:MAG: hypothetical protein P8163_00220 [Candidatus Thiodiazotropha sp.]